MFKKIFLLFLLISAILIISDYKNLGNWMGEYTFHESEDNTEQLGITRMKNYDVVIYKEKNKFYADIKLDGVQTLVRVRAKVIGNKKHIKFIFHEPLVDNITGRYITGEILLEFKIENSKLYTYWGKIIPLLYDNYKPNIYFKIKQ